MEFLDIDSGSEILITLKIDIFDDRLYASVLGTTVESFNSKNKYDRKKNRYLGKKLNKIKKKFRLKIGD